jgi:hypothetical protein
MHDKEFLKMAETVWCCNFINDYDQRREGITTWNSEGDKIYLTHYLAHKKTVVYISFSETEDEFGRIGFGCKTQKHFQEGNVKGQFFLSVLFPRNAKETRDIYMYRKEDLTSILFFRFMEGAIMENFDDFKKSIEMDYELCEEYSVLYGINL